MVYTAVTVDIESLKKGLMEIQPWIHSIYKATTSTTEVVLWKQTIDVTDIEDMTMICEIQLDPGGAGPVGYTRLYIGSTKLLEISRSSSSWGWQEDNATNSDSGDQVCELRFISDTGGGHTLRVRNLIVFPRST